MSLPAPSEENIRGGTDALGRWIGVVVQNIDLEADEAALDYAGVERLPGTLEAGLIECDGRCGAQYLVVLSSDGVRIRVLTPDSQVQIVSAEDVVRTLRADHDRSHSTEVDELLTRAGVTGRSASRARTALLRETAGHTRIARCWTFREPAGASFLRQLHDTGTTRRLVSLVIAHAIQYALVILSWWVIGRLALEGRLSPGWLMCWALLLLTTIPIRLFETWTTAVLAIGAGGLLRRRLLNGALKLLPDEVRHKSTGQFMASVFESEAVEALALDGGLLGLVALVEIAASLVLLVLGAAGILHAVLLLAWLGAVALAGVLYARHRSSWTETRLTMSHDLVERIIGHRTRLASEAVSCRHDREERALEEYLQRSVRMDRIASLLFAVAPHGWLILGIVGLLPALTVAPGSMSVLAVSLGGVLLGVRALEKLARSGSQLTGAFIAWQSITHLFHAAARPALRGSAAFASPPDLASASAAAQRAADRPTVLEAEGLVFRYRPAGAAALDGCTLRVARGDCLLLGGPSGSGKSTLASILVGLRTQESGLLLLNGLDRQTLGEREWRRHVVAAPQFHENHVLTASLAFNLLMGRRWPAEPADLDEAEAVCRELGLGDLLDRMPSGLLQMVGESGWRLSHGEQSRLFIARALLQNADVVVLDESFAALDPQNLTRAMCCVRARAETLIVIAHP
jgi:ATP-binding cassette subfamily B protein